jgi:phosphoribosyl 1,2-cyclic phosphodiesterase
MASAVRGVILSHEHGDHAGRVGEIAGALHVPVYCTSECLEAAAERIMKRKKGEEAAEVVTFTPGERFVLGAFRILPVETYHVRGAVGFRIESFDGQVAIFTDLPEISADIERAMAGCGVISIEADYDEKMLERGTYVEELKQRIRLSHMSNGTLAKFFGNGFDASGVHDIVLTHLSMASNLPFIAEAKIKSALRGDVRVTALSEANLPLSLEV